MSFDTPVKADASLYVSRRKKLLSAIEAELKPAAGSLVVLFANFERETERFNQESSFFYLTGLQEPGVALSCDLNNDATIYVPRFAKNRAQWVSSPVPLVQENASVLGVQKIDSFGKEVEGYSFHPFFSEQQYENVLECINRAIKAGGKIFTLMPNGGAECVEQRFVLERIKGFIPEFSQHLVDISPLVARMRRKKDMHEIENLYEAIYATTLAHEAAAQSMENELSECEVQGALEYIFTAAGGRAAFPSVVASGKNGTILHYTTNEGQLRDGDLVVVDIGAKINDYCADLTRTYPVSGKFTPRQRELYNAVLETQQHVAEHAKPGMWLSNKEEPSKSLQHLAQKFLESKGLGKYFTHGIGHFLGLDVHDVGDRTRPLQEGDVFTIEPGVYIPKEGIGIRIEDDFWMVKDGVVCLSEDLPRDPDAIERMMAQGLQESDCSDEDCSSGSCCGGVEH